MEQTPILFVFAVLILMGSHRVCVPSKADCSHTNPIGVAEEGSISNENLRASSDWHNETIRYSAEYGRLNGRRAWCPSTSASQWLQVDLGAAYYLCGVATQGKALAIPEWVTKYELSFSRNNLTWQVYDNNRTTELAGNINAHSVVRNALSEKVLARFIRFRPTDYIRWPCLRVEVYVQSIKPSFNLAPSSQSVIEGEDVIMGCGAIASPAPIIHWTFNGGNVTVNHDVIGWNLTLYSVKNNAHYEGEYACVASNFLDSVISPPAVLSIHARPHIVNHLKATRTYRRGKPVAFSCYATGDPQPSIRWTKDDRPIHSHTELHSGGHVLFIKELVMNDSGLYECTARNSVGESKTSSQLIVVDSPVIDLQLTRSKVLSQVELSANLGCYVMNNENVLFHWTKDGANLSTSKQIRILNNMLVVMPVTQEDFGTYVCHATNPYGTTNISIVVENSLCGQQTKSDHSNTRKAGAPNALYFGIIPLAGLLLVSLAINGYLLYRLKYQRNHGNKPVEDNVKMSEIQEDCDACAEDSNMMNNEIAWDNLILDDVASAGFYDFHNAGLLEDTDVLLKNDENERHASDVRS